MHTLLSNLPAILVNDMLRGEESPRRKTVWTFIHPCTASAARCAGEQIRNEDPFGSRCLWAPEGTAGEDVVAVARCHDKEGANTAVWDVRASGRVVHGAGRRCLTQPAPVPTAASFNP